MLDAFGNIAEFRYRAVKVRVKSENADAHLLIILTGLEEDTIDGLLPKAKAFFKLVWEHP